MHPKCSDLIGRMQTPEKISQLGNTAPAIERLKVPAYQWWSEALHGIASSPGVHFGGNVHIDIYFNAWINALYCYTLHTHVQCQTILYIHGCRCQMPLPSHKSLDLVQPSTCMCVHYIISHSPLETHVDGSLQKLSYYTCKVCVWHLWSFPRRSLIRAIGQVIGTEARAMHNVGQAGLTFFTPDLNILRDPRWGRGQEVPGEGTCSYTSQ